MLDNKVKMIIRFTLILVMTIQAQALTWEESKKLLKEKNECLLKLQEIDILKNLLNEKNNELISMYN